ncbi:MAG TPA: FtsX-like permease family protein [Verrucomicrobiae bacterium]
MTLWLIIRRSLRQHALSTFITALSIALATGLLMSVWTIKVQSNNAFTSVNCGFDAVLGARGSKLQLVLNSIFHLEESPGNIAWEHYETIKKNPNIQAAIPIAVGDNYHGYRLVGTTTNLFSDVEYVPGRKFTVRSGGRIFDQEYREAVVGSYVAEQLGLKYGDKFQPYHGLIFNENDQHAETYVVVGIMEPSNTPADRVIWIPLAGLQKMSGHTAASADQLSAVLIKFKAGSPLIGRQLEQMYNKQGDKLTFAWPIAMIVAQLFNKIAWFDRVLAAVAVLVAVVAAGSVLASIYNSMNERRRDIAILRALGARKGTIFSAVVLEAASIGAIGAVAGLAVYGVITLAAAQVIRAQTGVVLDATAFNPMMIGAPLGLIVLSALCGVVPALKAYRTNVADNLVPVS